MEISFRHKLLFLLFFFLPFHVILMYSLKNFMGLGEFNIFFILIKMWKEFCVIFIILISIKYHFEKKNYYISLNKIDIWVLLFLILGLYYTLLEEFNTIAVWSFRSLFSCYFLYLLGRVANISINQVKILLSMCFFIAILTAIFGIVQVELLGIDFYENVYGSEGHLGLYAIGYDKLRAQSTFITSHEFGLFLVFNLFALPFLTSSKKISIKKKQYYFLGSIIILVGLFYSFSRSSILILIIGYLYYLLKNFKRNLLFLFIVAVLVVFTLVTLLGISENISRTIKGIDPSTAGHLLIILDALNIAINNPFGIGIGTVGVVVRRFIPTALQFEGEWFNIIVQLGFLGGLGYFYIYFLVTKKAKFFLKNIEDNPKMYELSLYVLLISIGMILRDLILPRDQMNYWLGWFIIGLYTTLAHQEISVFKSKED